MKLILNKSICLDKLRIKFLEKLKKYYFSLKITKTYQLYTTIYYTRMVKSVGFKTKDGSLIKGQINGGVSYDGKLKILFNDLIKEFDSKINSNDILNIFLDIIDQIFNKF